MNIFENSYDFLINQEYSQKIHRSILLLLKDYIIKGPIQSIITKINDNKNYYININQKEYFLNNFEKNLYNFNLFNEYFENGINFNFNNVFWNILKFSLNKFDYIIGINVFYILSKLIYNKNIRSIDFINNTKFLLNIINYIELIQYDNNNENEVIEYEKQFLSFLSILFQFLENFNSPFLIDLEESLIQHISPNYIFFPEILSIIQNLLDISDDLLSKLIQNNIVNILIEVLIDSSYNNRKASIFLLFKIFFQDLSLLNKEICSIIVEFLENDHDKEILIYIINGFSDIFELNNSYSENIKSYFLQTDGVDYILKLLDIDDYEIADLAELFYEKYFDDTEIIIE